MVTLDDVAAPVRNAIVDGPFGSNLKLDDYVPEGVPVLQGKNITYDTFRWFDVRFISSRKAEELKRSSVRIGDILIVKIGSIGYSAILDDLNGFDHAIIPANLAKVTPNLSKVDLRYLYRCLTSTAAKNYLVRVASKTAQPALSLGKIKGLPIPLPPLPEQRRIAEILDKVDALRAKRRATLAQLDTLTQSIFLDMFGDPATNPKGWPTSALEDLFEISRGGSPRPIDDYITESPEGVNWIMIGDAPEGSKYITATKKKIKPEGVKRSRGVKSGDFLLTNSMSFGRPYIMRTSGCIHDGWLVLSPRRSNVVPDYFYSLLGSRALYTEFSRRAPGATVKNLNIGLVRSVVVPVPPESKQREYADRVSAIEELTVPFQRSLDGFEGLFSSLQQRLFRGEL